MTAILTIHQDPATEKVVLLTDGIIYDYFNTVEEAETRRDTIREENKVTEFIEDAIDDLRQALMADPYNLDCDQADRVIKDEVNL